MRSLVLIVCALTLTFGSTTAVANEHVREGWQAGFNLGGGSAALELKPTDDATISTDRVDGGAGNLRFGYAVRPDLVIGLEVNGWGRDQAGFIFGVQTTVQWRLSVAAIAATWYPGEGGFYVRAGVGGGTGRVRAFFGGLGGEAEANGPGVLGAIGYEFRLGQRFALGPQLDFGAVKLGEIENIPDDDGDPTTADFTANYSALSVGFNWYW